MTDTCDHGHPWTPENTRIRPASGGRRRQRECRECHRAKLRARRDQRWRARHAGHDITRDALGRRRCLTCPPPDTTRAADPVAVELALTGTPPAGLSTGDRRQTIPRLAARGLTSAQIAELLGCSDRTVTRIRTRARQETAA